MKYNSTVPAKHQIPKIDNLYFSHFWGSYNTRNCLSCCAEAKVTFALKKDSENNHNAVHREFPDGKWQLDKATVSEPPSVTDEEDAQPHIIQAVSQADENHRQQTDQGITWQKTLVVHSHTPNLPTGDTHKYRQPKGGDKAKVRHQYGRRWCLI